MTFTNLHRLPQGARVWLRPSLWLVVLLALVSSPATAATYPVVYVAYEEPTSWQPIWRDDVAKIIEGAALDVLTASGLMTLTKRDPKKLKESPPGILLQIVGRFVPEAETHTILISFEGYGNGDVGSFRASQTVVIGKQPRATMLEKIEASTRSAAQELIRALKPALERSTAEQPAPLFTDEGKVPPLPWKWAEVTIPKVHVPNAEDLYGKNADKRAAALRGLTSLALTQDRPRQVLEHCVLSHPDAQVRLGCLIALRPASRKQQPTQRVVIEVLRKDTDGRVMGEASEQMLYFTGVSRAEAIAAWLERTATGGVAVGPLKELGDLPNLDLVIAKCMVSAAALPSYQRSKSSCIELLAPLTYKRRRAVLWPFLAQRNPQSPLYLEGAGEREGSMGTEWGNAVDALTEASCGIDQAFEDVLWERYQRTLSASALDALTECGTPSTRLAERMLSAFQTTGSHQVLHALKRMAKTDAAIKKLALDKIAELAATGSYNKSTRRSVNPRDLDAFVKELNREP